MEKKRIFTARQIAPWLIFFLVFAFAVWAGLSDPQFQYLEAPGWSRAKLIGETDQRLPVPVVVDDEGNSYFLLVQEETLNIKSLNATGSARWEASYDAWTATPSQYRLIRNQDALHLIWLEESRLYTAALDLSGQPLQSTQQREFPVAVTAFSVAANDDGLHIWASDGASRPGLYAVIGNQEPILVDEEGFQPLLQLDSSNNLHVIWQRRASAGVFLTQYATKPAGGELTAAREVATINAARARLRGPWFGLQDDLGYLSYAIDILVDPAAGQSFAKYVAFPLATDAPASEPLDFVIPYGRAREYSVVGEGPAGERVMFPERRSRTAKPLEVASIVSGPNAGTEGVSAVRVSVEHLKQREVSQVALQFWQDGEPNGYQMVTFSGRASQQPALTRTGEGDLALTYLEGSPGRFQVYFAATVPETKAAFSQLLLQDYGLFVMDSLTGMLQSITFAPFSFLLWSVFPFFLLLGVSYLRPAKASWTDRRFLGYLAIAVLIFSVAKYLTLGPAILSYIPFSAWIPELEGGLALLFRVIVPIVITLFAGYSAWQITRRRIEPSILVIFIIYTLIDTTLSMSIYGGYLYNAF